MSYRHSLTEFGTNFRFEEDEGLKEGYDDEVHGMDETGVKRPTRRITPARRGRGRATAGITRTVNGDFETDSEDAAALGVIGGRRVR